MDGDGDLDLLTANSQDNTVSVRLNDGTGTFGGGSDPVVGSAPYSVAVGDVDGDGDLDLLAASSAGTNTVSVRLNDGTGVFSGGSEVPVGSIPQNVVMGDVDGDGDLDLLAANNGSNTVSVRLNDGTGTFGGGSDPAVGSSPYSVALGDVDGDGDLDLLTANNTVGVRLNDGAGNFSGGSNPVVGGVAQSVAVGDVDGDGDLDLLTANANNPGTVSVRLNLPPAPTLTAVSPAAELPGNSVTLTGTNFTAASTVRFGGTAGTAGTGVVVNSATSITVTVPVALAPGSVYIVVNSASGSSLTAPPFTALAVYSGGTLDACVAAVPATASVNDGAWHYLLNSGSQVVAAYNYTGTSLGNLAVDVLRANTTAAVRKDSHNHYYLDRNFHLTASAGPFTGRTVNVRFYGLNTEQTRLQAMDATATLANLKVTQYSGPNEDCSLGNNSATGERRTLPAPASTPAGAPWFVAEVAVADHFSEFYLTGSSAPLPVELAAFTATAAGPAAVRLAWTTASEKNSASFDVERSLDGTAFARLAAVAAAGTSSSVRSYGLVDAKLPAGAALFYYRLKQVDADGTFAYSPVRSVALTAKAGTGLALFPNPAHGGAATLTGAVPGTVVTVYDAVGRRVTSAPADATGTAALLLPAGLPAGVYVVCAGAKALRLVVE